MFNKYLLLGAVYRYISEFNKLKNADKIKQHFFELTVESDLAVQAMIRKRLEYSYDIVDGDTCLDFLEDLKSQRPISQPFYSVLVDLWQTNKELTTLENLSITDLNLTDDYLLSQIHRYEQSLSADDEAFFLEALKDQISNILIEPQGIYRIYNTLDKYAELVNMANPYIYWGYDIARFVEITRESYGVGYISLDEANRALNALGEVVESKFSSWEQYLASTIIGKCFKSDGDQFKNNDILSIKAYVASIYEIVNSPNNLFKPSHMWAHSNLNQLSFKMEKLFELKPKKIANALSEYGVNYYLKNQSITALYNYVLKPLSESGLLSFIRSTKEIHPLLYAVADTEDDICFWKKFDQLKSEFELFFSKSETPLLNFNNFYLSNKALYYTKRKLWRKKVFIIPITDLYFKIVPNLENMSFTLYAHENKVLIFQHKDLKNKMESLDGVAKLELKQDYLNKCKYLNELLNDFSTFK